MGQVSFFLSKVGNHDDKAQPRYWTELKLDNGIKNYHFFFLFNQHFDKIYAILRAMRKYKKKNNSKPG